MNFDIEELNYKCRVILNPNFWLRNFATNWEHDAWLKSALKNPIFKHIDDYTISLNGQPIWTENYPYSYGYLYAYLGTSKPKLPSRATALRLHDLVTEFKRASGTF